MRKDRNVGIVLSTALLLPGSFLLHEATTHTEWYRDIYLIAGSTISAIGLMAGSWTVTRHLSIRRMERHVRGHQQIESR